MATSVLLKKKRIVHLIVSLAVGGTERQLLLILPALQTNYENEVVCLNGGGIIAEQLRQRRVVVHNLRGRFNGNVLVAWRLFRLLRRRHPAVLITYLFYADIIGRIIGRLSGVKTIITSHRSRLFGPWYWHQIDRFTRWLVTHYTVQTEATKQALQKVLKLSPSRLTVIPNAVALLPTKRSTAHTELKIICVANLKPEKGLPLLIEAFTNIASLRPIQLWLVGEGPERAALEQQIAASPAHSQIHLLGAQTDIPALLVKSDIFVLPTLIEGMSNALLEAMAAGLPCVTSDIPVNQEVITHGVNGLLFKTNNVTSLTEQLTRLVTDPALQARLGTAARAHVVEKYSVENVGQQWQNLIEKLTK